MSLKGVDVVFLLISFLIAICITALYIPSIILNQFYYDIPVHVDLTDSYTGAVAIKWGEEENEFVRLTPKPLTDSPTTVEIRATAEKSSDSMDHQVWILGIKRADDSSIPLEEVTLGEGWSHQDGKLVFLGDQPSSIGWTSSVSEAIYVNFLMHDWSGIIETTLDGQTQKFDLYALDHTQKQITFNDGQEVTRWSGNIVAPHISDLSIELINGWISGNFIAAYVGGPLEQTFRSQDMSDWGQLHNITLQSTEKKSALLAHGNHPNITIQNVELESKSNLLLENSIKVSSIILITLLLSSILYILKNHLISHVPIIKPYQHILIVNIALFVAAIMFMLHQVSQEPPDDTLFMRLGVETDNSDKPHEDMVGQIQWGDSNQTYEDNWPISLTAAQFSEIKNVRIQVQPIEPGSINPNANGNHIGIYDIMTDIMPRMQPNKAQHDTYWIAEKHSRLPNGTVFRTDAETTDSSFIYNTEATNWVKVIFAVCPDCEGTKVTVNGETRYIDLYHPGITYKAIHFNLSSTIDNIGVTPIPIVGGIDQFELNLGRHVQNIRLYGIESSNYPEEIWSPDDSLQIGSRNQITSTTSDYIEIATEPDTNLKFTFNTKSTNEFVWPNPIELLTILIVFFVSYCILLWRYALWNVFQQLIEKTYNVLLEPPPLANVGWIRWAVLLSAFLIRLGYAIEDPIWISGDSSTYLKTALWVKHGFSYPLTNDQLDHSGIGYPVFLSIVFLLLGTDYSSIIIAQLCIGMLTVYGGIRIGELLGSKWISIALGTFLAIAPNNLHFEHLIMTEVLSTATAIWCSVFALQFIRNPSQIHSGIALAFCGAFTFYNRSNMLIIVAIWLFIAMIITFTPLIQSKVTKRRIAIHWCIIVTIIASLITPWIIRNAIVYDQATLMASSNRGRLMLWGIADLIKLSPPKISQFSGEYNSIIPYIWIYTFGESRLEGEIVAEKLWDEQISFYPQAYQDRVFYSFANLLGQEAEGRVEFPIRLSKRSFDDIDSYTFTYGTETLSLQPYGIGRTEITSTLNYLWKYVFEPARLPISLLSIGCIFALSIWLIFSLTYKNTSQIITQNQLFTTLILVGLGYTWIVTMIIFSLNVAYQPRYIFPFDWIRVAIIAWGGEIVWQKIRYPFLKFSSN